MLERAKRCDGCEFLACDLDGNAYACGLYPCWKPIDDVDECPKEKAKMDETKNSLAAIVCGLMDEKKDLFKRKAQQYGIGDELANFRDGAAAMQLNPESLDDCFQALKGYCNKHISFVQRSRELNDKVDESLGDIAVYALIAQAMWRMKKGE